MTPAATGCNYQWDIAHATQRDGKRRAPQDLEHFGMLRVVGAKLVENARVLFFGTF